MKYNYAINSGIRLRINLKLNKIVELLINQGID